MSTGRGGKRKGAGRKKGATTKRTQEIAAKAMKEGLTPLEFMLNVMRGAPPEGASPAEIIAFTSMRFEAAKSAAPYVHPKLAANEHKGPDGGPVQHCLTVKFV